MKHVDPVESAKRPVRAAHGPKPRTYITVWAALLVLTILEVLVTYISGLPQAPVLLTMSAAKALLVILYFMHLRYDSRWYAFVFFAPFALVIPLIFVSLIP